MELKTYKFDLQLFAGEGAGDGGASGGESATGENSAAAGQGMEARLMELGVPKEKLRKRANRYKDTQPAKPAAQEGHEQEATVEPDAEGQVASATETATAKVSWDDFMSDPENNKRMQGIVQSRLKSAKAAEEAMNNLAPALEVLARKYGIDVKDTAAIAEAVNGDAQYYEDKALELGTSIEEAMKQDRTDRDTARQQQQEAETLQQQKFQEHLSKLEQQGNALKAIFPAFDLRTELQNPAFARMTAPSVGISVEDAYYAVHRREIQQATAQATAQNTAKQISNAIQAGSRRPVEAGTSAQAPSSTEFNYRTATAEQRDALRKAIRAAAASGKKLYPGEFRP